MRFSIFSNIEYMITQMLLLNRHCLIVSLPSFHSYFLEQNLGHPYNFYHRHKSIKKQLHQKK